MALVIIMLSALEEQVSGFYFFGVLNYLKMIQKNRYSKTLWQILLKNDKKQMQLLVRKEERRRRGHFWSLPYFLEGTPWTIACASGVPCLLSGAAHRALGPPFCRFRDLASAEGWSALSPAGHELPSPVPGASGGQGRAGLSHPQPGDAVHKLALTRASFPWHREALGRSKERPQICLHRKSDQQTDLSVFFFSSFLFSLVLCYGYQKYCN